MSWTCDDCACPISQGNYGGWWDKPFIRSHLCRDCFGARKTAKRRDERATLIGVVLIAFVLLGMLMVDAVIEARNRRKVPPEREPPRVTEASRPAPARPTSPTPIRPVPSIQYRVRSVWEGHGGGVVGVNFSADGKRLLSTGRDAVSVRDVSSGNLLRTIPFGPDTVTSAWLNPDGSKVVVTGRNPLGSAIAQLWSVDAGKRLHDFGGSVIAAQFDFTGGRVVAAGTDGSIREWDVSKGGGWVGESRRPTEAEELPVFTSVWSNPKGSSVLAADSFGGVKVWDLKTRRRVADLGRNSFPFRAAVVSPDGRFYAATGSGGTRVYDATSGLPVKSFTGVGQANHSAMFSRDSAWLVTVGSESAVTVLRAGDFTPVTTIAPNGRSLFADLDRDGGRVAIGGEDGTVQVWERVR